MNEQERNQILTTLKDAIEWSLEVQADLAVYRDVILGIVKLADNECPHCRQILSLIKMTLDDVDGKE